jgi:drug/metabolite transporter (DMT)-like permease
MTESQRLVGYAAFAAVIAFNALGNLMLKVGANAPPVRYSFDLVSWQSLAGIGCFACAVLAYAWTLKQFPLHVAQIIVSVQYIVTIALAASVLGEPISATRWFGVGLIAVGLYFCSR